MTARRFSWALALLLCFAARAYGVIVPAMEKAVAFLFDDRAEKGVECPKTWAIIHDCGLLAGCHSRTYCPLATGFLTGFPNKEQPGRLVTWLVTAGHVVRNFPPDQTMFARLTTGDEEDSFIPLDRSKWVVPPDPRWDLAVYGGPLPIEKLEGISTADYATEKVLKDQGVTVGDSIFTLGLVPGIAGKKRNFPVARQGTLALVDTSPEGPGEGIWYLAEAQVYEGNSGPSLLGHWRLER